MNDINNEMIYEKLFKALLRGGIKSIAEVTYEIFNLPVVIISVEYKVFAQVPERYIGDVIWDTLLKNKRVPAEMVWQFKQDLYVKKVDSSERSLFVDWGMVTQIPRIMGNFKVYGTIEGYIGILFPDGGCTERHLEITDIICKSISLELQKDNNFRVSKPSLQIAFMLDLFQGNIKDESTLENWLSHADIELKNNFCIAAAKLETSSSEFSILKYIRKRIEENSQNAYSIVIEDTLFIMFTTLPSNMPYDNIINNSMEGVFSIINMYKLNIGLSNVFSNILELEIYKYQAVKALSIGLLKCGKKEIYKYRDSVVYDMLSYSMENMNKQNYIHPIIVSLQSYDKQHNTEYLITLCSYIKSMCNSAKTIKELNLHRNTLLYRLNKIQKITDTDITDNLICAQLLCNFYMLDTYIENDNGSTGI